MADSQYLLDPNIDEIKQLIDTIYSNREKYIRELDRESELYKRYRLLKAKVDIIRDADEYDQVIEYLRELPSSRNEYKIGTLGAFLFGCINKPSGYCNPYCINSIAPKGVQWTDCVDELWEINNGYINKINDITSKNARIIVSGSDRPTPEQLEVLRNRGVQNIVVYNPNGQPINTIPLQTPTAQIKGKSTATNWIILLIIFIVIIAIAYLIINGLSQARRDTIVIS